MTTKSSYPGLFGLRLAHGLHLGHLVGNVRPALQDKDERKIIIILADLFTYTSQRKADVTLNNILSMVAECWALGLNSSNVKFVIQSEVFRSILPLYTILCCSLKFSTLKATKPLSRLLERESEIHFGELSFPIIQCAEMIATNSEVLYSNVDNLGLIALSRNLSKKLSNHTKINLPVPRLVHGDPNTLRGLDYRKMSASMANALFLSDNANTIKQKIRGINTAVSKDIDVDLRLIYDYFKVIGYREHQINYLQKEFSDNKIGALGLKHKLANELDTHFEKIKRKKKKLLSDKPALINRINSDTKELALIIDQNVETFFSKFYSKDFYDTFKTRGVKNET